MPRIVKHDATGPYRLDPADFPRDPQGNLKPLFICACGLSKRLPFCDGTHKQCAGEEPGSLYTYDPATGQVIEKRQAR